MFQTHKALLSTLIVSFITVQTTQPIDWGWLTNNSIYQQGTELCSRLSKTDAYKQCAPYGKPLLTKAKQYKGLIADLIASTAALITTLKLYATSQNMRQKIKNNLKSLFEVEKSENIIFLQSDHDIAHKCAENSDDETEKLKNILLKPMIEYDDWDEIESLIQNGANIDSVDKNGNTLLHNAVLSDNYPAVSMLLRHAASTCIQNDQGKTPYELALYTPHHAISGLLSQQQKKGL